MINVHSLPLPRGGVVVGALKWVHLCPSFLKLRHVPFPPGATNTGPEVAPWSWHSVPGFADRKGGEKD